MKQGFLRILLPQLPHIVDDDDDDLWRLWNICKSIIDNTTYRLLINNPVIKLVDLLISFQIDAVADLADQPEQLNSQQVNWVKLLILLK